MLLIHHWNVKKGRREELEAWLLKNEGLLSKHVPPGWVYLGAFAAEPGFGKHAISVFWNLKGKEDLEKFNDHDDKIWQRLGDEAEELLDTDSFEMVLLREIGGMNRIGVNE